CVRDSFGSGFDYW
nr:immunoglobulin heavy chain junction region [Macaca mulatta]